MIKVRVVEVEGDPEEVLRVKALFGSASSEQPKPLGRSDVAPGANGSAQGATITRDLVLRVLTRRDLDRGPRNLFKALLKAGPKGMTSEELADAMGIDRGQLLQAY